jgi:hypothetical protein
MPVFACFSYSTDLTLDAKKRNAAQRAWPGLRRMPATCFSYSAVAPLGPRNRNATQPGPGDHPSLPEGQRDSIASACVSCPVAPCFRY